MLHCPNGNHASHPSNLDIRFFAEAIVQTNSYCLVQEFIEFLPTKANCGHCVAEAVGCGASTITNKEQYLLPETSNA